MKYREHNVHFHIAIDSMTFKERLYALISAFTGKIGLYVYDDTLRGFNRKGRLSRLLNRKKK